MEVEYSKGVTDENKGFFNKLFYVFFEPSKAFDAIFKKPSVWIEFLLIVIALTMLAIPKVPSAEKYTRDMYEKIYKNEEFLKSQPTITEKNADSYIDKMVAYTKYGVYGGAALVILGLLIQGGVTHMILKLFGGTAKFSATLSVFALSYFINLLGEAVRTVNVYISGNYAISNSIGMLMQDNKLSFLYNLLSLLDAFTIWYMIVAALGLSIVHKIGRKKAYIAVFTVWMLYILYSAASGTLAASQLYTKFGIVL